MPLPTHVTPPRSASVDLVRDALVRRRMSQKDLAREIGIPRDQLARILAGKVPFPRNRQLLSSMARALDLEPSDFLEYRERLNVLPESTRRLVDHLHTVGMSVEGFSKRLKRLEAGQAQLILRGGAPFPRDPAILEDLAQAAETTPFLFGEYLPIGELKERLLKAADMALSPASYLAFEGLLSSVERHLELLDTQGFDERVIMRMLERTASPAEDEPLDDMLAFLPRFSDLQPEVQRVLLAMRDRRWTPIELAARAGVDLDELFAYAKGQLKLSDPDVLARLERALSKEKPDGEDPPRG